MTDDALPPTPPAPDPRFRLANERTLLAWMRTTLGLLAGAVAAASPVSRLSSEARAGLGILLVVAAAVTARVGWTRWRAVDEALTTGGPLPDSASVRWIVVAMTATVVAVAIAIITETLL